MTLDVKLNSYLSRYSTLSGDLKVEFEEAMTVAMLLESLGIPMDEVSVASFEGQMLDANSPITQSGRLDLFPAIIGG